MLEQNAKPGISLSFPSDFFPELWLADDKQSSDPDPIISVIQAEDALQAAGTLERIGELLPCSLQLFPTIQIPLTGQAGE